MARYAAEGNLCREGYCYFLQEHHHLVVHSLYRWYRYLGSWSGHFLGLEKMEGLEIVSESLAMRLVVLGIRM